PRARRGARSLARGDGHRRRAALDRRRDAAQRLPHHRGHGVRRAPADALPHDAGGGPSGACARRTRWRQRARADRRGGGGPREHGPRRTRHQVSGVSREGLALSRRDRPLRRRRRAGKLLGLDAERQRNAFGLAGSQSAGTFAQWGTPTIKFHQSRGALSGLLAALLAKQGFPSSTEILTHEDGGLFNTYSDGGDPEAVTDGLGERWELEAIGLRLW